MREKLDRLALVVSNANKAYGDGSAEGFQAEAVGAALVEAVRLATDLRNNWCVRVRVYTRDDD